MNTDLENRSIDDRGTMKGMAAIIELEKEAYKTPNQVGSTGEEGNEKAPEDTTWFLIGKNGKKTTLNEQPSSSRLVQVNNGQSLIQFEGLQRIYDEVHSMKKTEIEKNGVARDRLKQMCNMLTDLQSKLQQDPINEVLLDEESVVQYHLV
ncbi:hypothetical protein ACFE04_009599 [Oxalis oulophora]